MDTSKPLTQPRMEPAPAEPLRKHAKAVYQMRLFIAGDEPNSVIARKNIQQICSGHLNKNYTLQVIDVFEDFTEAIKENILVTPALVVDQPKKLKIFGNLQEQDKVLAALGLL